MEDALIELYEKEEDISPIVSKLKSFSFDNLIKTPHFEYSLDQKNTDLSLIKEKFIEFERVRLVQKRKHKNGKINYDFYYELDDGTYILYAIAFSDKPILINAFHVDRNFRNFKKRLIKAYRDKIIG